MKDFYSRILDGSSPMDALRDSQLAAIRGDLELTESDVDRSPIRPNAKQIVARQKRAVLKRERGPARLWAGIQFSGPGDLTTFSNAEGGTPRRTGD